LLKQQNPQQKTRGNMANLETATLGGGCFWCIESAFNHLKGVVRAVSGYAGGQIPNPTYQQICTGMTGHAEVVQVTFDTQVISFAELLHVFFSLHDPTQLNRQGNDRGTQYRSVIFYHDSAQQEVASQVLSQLSAGKVWSDPIVTELTELNNYSDAEDYHQDYPAKNPQNQYCQYVVNPKLAKFKQQYAEQLKD
jgi:peptide-methionine (S)-S-oxide reductase